MPRLDPEPEAARHPEDMPSGSDDKVLGAFGVAAGIVILVAVVAIALNSLLY